MSNLRIYVNAASDSRFDPRITTACGEAPPARGVDNCHISLPLTLEGTNSPPPRLVAFDRQGDRFVLSPQNSGEALTWVSSQQHLPEVFNTLRIAGLMTRSQGPAGANSNAFLWNLWISRYITSGDYRMDLTDRSGPAVELWDSMIEMFEGSSARGIVPVLGALSYFRQAGDLPVEARDRIREFTALMDVIPLYRSYRNHLVPVEERGHVGHLSDADFTRWATVERFARRSFLALSRGEPLRFNGETLAASRAYGELRSNDIATGQRLDFCRALEAAVSEMGSRGSVGANFLNECREALNLGAQPREAALRDSLRRWLTNPSALQQGISVESTAANMRIDWLQNRMVFRQVLDLVLESVGVSYPSEDATAMPAITFDLPRFRNRLGLLTSLTSRGEYDLSALAFLRRLFGSEGDSTRPRLFAAGLYQDLRWGISPAALIEIRQLQNQLQGRRRSSADFSQVGMPVLLGSGCAVGVGGIVLSQTLPAIRNNNGARLGLGTASSGLAGAGCFGLAGHFVWPAVAPGAVHNRYAWDLGSSAVGSAVGIGTYLLLHFLTAGRTPGQRNPTDPFGP